MSAIGFDLGALTNVHQSLARLIERADSALGALGHTEDDDAPLDRVLDALHDVLAVGGHVARPVALEDHALDRRLEEVGDGFAARRK